MDRNGARRLVRRRRLRGARRRLRRREQVRHGLRPPRQLAEGLRGGRQQPVDQPHAARRVDARERDAAAERRRHEGRNPRRDHERRGRGRPRRRVRLHAFVARLQLAGRRNRRLHGRHRPLRLRRRLRGLRARRRPREVSERREGRGVRRRLPLRRPLQGQTKGARSLRDRRRRGRPVRAGRTRRCRNRRDPREGARPPRRQAERDILRRDRLGHGGRLQPIQLGFREGTRRRVHDGRNPGLAHRRLRRRPVRRRGRLRELPRALELRQGHRGRRRSARHRGLHRGAVLQRGRPPVRPRRLGRRRTSLGRPVRPDSGADRDRRRTARLYPGRHQPGRRRRFHLLFGRVRHGSVVHLLAGRRRLHLHPRERRRLLLHVPRDQRHRRRLRQGDHVGLGRSRRPFRPRQLRPHRLLLHRQLERCRRRDVLPPRRGRKRLRGGGRARHPVGDGQRYLLHGGRTDSRHVLLARLRRRERHRALL